MCSECCSCRDPGTHDMTRLTESGRDERATKDELSCRQRLGRQAAITPAGAKSWCVRCRAEGRAGPAHHPRCLARAVAGGGTQAREAGDNSPALGG